MRDIRSNTSIKTLLRLRYLAPILLVIGTIGLYFSTIIYNPYTIQYSLALIIATAIYYYYSKKEAHITRSEIGSRYSTGILCIYIVALFCLIMSYYASSLQRTDSIFYLTFFLYIMSGIHIITTSNFKTSLTMIVIASVTNRLTAYYNSALYNGVDIYTHSQLIESIVLHNSLTGLRNSKYFYSPFYHILSAVGEIVYAVPTRDALALTVSLTVTILPTVVVYKLTYQFWNKQIGLIASLLYATADHTINWGIHVIPTSLGVVFFSLLILSIMKYTIWQKKRQYALMMTFLFGLVFTHQVSLFIGITSMVTLALVIALYQLDLSRISLNISILAGIVVLFNFITTKYNGPAGEVSFFSKVITVLIRSIQSAGVATRPEVAYPQDPSISPTGAAALTLEQVMGSALLITLAVIGTLYWISTQRSDRQLFVGISFGILVTVLLSVTLAGPVVGLNNLLPHRWWAFIYIGLAVLAAPGLWWLCHTFPDIIRANNSQRIFVILTLFLVIMTPYVVLMGGNWIGASDQPLLQDAHGAQTMQISDSEKRLFRHVVKYKGDIVMRGDRRANSILSAYYDISTQPLYITYDKPESLDRPSIIINREYIHTKHSQYLLRFDGRTAFVHGKFPINELNAQNRSTIYQSNKHSLELFR